MKSLIILILVILLMGGVYWFVIDKDDQYIEELELSGTEAVEVDCALTSRVFETSILEGTGFRIPVSGYKGTEDQLNWNVLDERIVTVSPLGNGRGLLEAINEGSTLLIITDTSVGSDCSISIPVTVFGRGF